MSTLLRPGRLAAGVLSIGLLALPAGAGAAPAPPLAASAFAGGRAACTPAPTSQAFAKVDHDQADYTAAPGGAFEPGGTAWTLARGARLVAGNESLGVAPGSRSLLLPIGATALSPKFCVDATNPAFRFAFKVDGLGAGFLARVTYEGAGGVQSSQLFSSQQIKLLPSKWQASPSSPLATLIPLREGTATVQIQLVGIAVPVANTVLSRSLIAVPGVTVDSVMVDPSRRS